MAQKKNTYEKLQTKYARKTDSFYKQKEMKELYETLSGGQNTYLKFARVQNNAIDFTWAKKIIETLPDLGDIVGNPKKTIQTLTEVIQVEKVKKVGVETVAHLSSHTQYIKTVDENGNVTPSKLLNIYSDDFFAIYENKFIATLIRKLVIFVEKRYEILKQKEASNSVKLFMVKNHTDIVEQQVDIETKVKFTYPPYPETREKLRNYIKQVEDIRKYLRFYVNSAFMKILKREKDVRGEIHQTNIIRKNPKYRNCYHLWLFIQRYRDTGLDLKVEEQFTQLTPKEIKEINQVMCANFLLLKSQDIRKGPKKIKVYKPKILNTYDDEIYRPEPYDGPIEFIRIDEKYRNYLETLYDLPQHPSKSEAMYSIEEYRENKRRKELTKQVDSLLKRKELEKAKWEKDEAFRDERERNRDAYVDARAEKEIREEAIARTEKVRKELIAEANRDRVNSPKPLKKKTEEGSGEPTVDFRVVTPNQEEVEYHQKLLAEKKAKKTTSNGKGKTTTKAKPKTTSKKKAK